MSAHVNYYEWKIYKENENVFKLVKSESDSIYWNIRHFYLKMKTFYFIEN